MQDVLDFIKQYYGAVIAFLGLGTLAGVEAKYKWFRRFVARLKAEPFLGSVPLKILVAPLLHDKDNRQTDHVVNALRTHLKAGAPDGHCDYKVLPDPIHRQTFASGSEEEQRIARRIQNHMARRKADIMIWGHVVKEDQSLHLAITARQA